MWSRGKDGMNVGHLRRKIRMEREFLTRDLNDMYLFRVPVESWVGQTLAFAYRRYNAWVVNEDIVDDAEERRVFEALGREIRDDGEFFIMLLRHYDRDLYWHYVSANRDPEVVKKLLLHPKLLPGFNDSGAHVTNMAFFDGNLRALRIALDDGEACFSHMVGRLTREPADFFGFNDVGRIRIGGRADLALINPGALRAYDGEASVQYMHRDLFGCHQLVNRSDGVVAGVYVGGERVWHDHAFTPVHGARSLGQALRVGASGT
jgi:N-acyl-D-aspartate/D-glutamate deacylase